MVDIDNIAAKRLAFHRLHESGCFVIPNPWDAGSARWLKGLGFEALASTSSGAAWAQGKADGAMPLDAVLAHLRELVAATDLPVNADFGNGYGADLGEVADSVARVIDTGVAGLSIEDSTDTSSGPVFDRATAIARLRAAREAIDRAGGDTLLVGRSECMLFDANALDETIARLKAYADAGADCLYAPGIRTREQIEAVVAAVAPRPVNLLVMGASEFTLADIAAMGVRRVSLGGGLARAAWGGFMRAAGLIAQQRRFDGLKDAAAGSALNGFFR